MHRNVITLFVCLIAVSGCNSGSQKNTKTVEPAKTTSARTKAINSSLVKYENDTNLTGKELSWIIRQKENIKSSLIDPKSAMFRNVLISRAKGAPAVLGEVNSKNRFGGYTGYKRFFAAEHIQAIEGDNISSYEFNKLWDEFVP